MDEIIIVRDEKGKIKKVKINGAEIKGISSLEIKTLDIPYETSNEITLKIIDAKIITLY